MVNAAQVSRWLSAEGYSYVLASNTATLLSMDFPPGEQGSCRQTCSYCYARRGKQSMPRARQLQWMRFRWYLGHQEWYANRIYHVLIAFRQRFEIPIGQSPRYPLRLFGSGDMKDPHIFRRFARALDSLGICYFGYTRFHGRGLRKLAFSCDSQTPTEELHRAEKVHRRLAYVRRPNDNVPMSIDVIFPEHRARGNVPHDRRDCYKLRHEHKDGVCYQCKRCFS